MKRYIIAFGAVAIFVTALAWFIAILGPQDYEFGPQWGYMWETTVYPTFLIMDKLFLTRVIYDFGAPWNWLLPLSILLFINFVLGGVLGALVSLILKLRKTAEQDAAANP